jgi:hypothetical protein
MIACPRCDLIIDSVGPGVELSDEPCEPCKARDAVNDALLGNVDGKEHTDRFQAVLDAIHEYQRLFVRNSSLDQLKVEKIFDEVKDALFNIDDADLTKAG